jgi:2-keto-myo-inositol isomerase
MDLSKFGMDTVTLAGTLAEKLQAISGAGFSQFILWARDLVGQPEGAEAAVRTVRESGLGISGFQLLRDFEGLSGDLLDYKLEIAQTMMEMMQAVGSDLLLVCSSTSLHATSDTKNVAQDLSKLATLAAPLGIRVGYEALAWGRGVNEYPAAWEAVKREDRENVGLVVDSFHILVKGTSLEYLGDIPVEKVVLVQLSDNLWALDDVIQTARGRRVFPGEGIHSGTVSRHRSARGSGGLSRRLHLRGLQRRISPMSVARRCGARPQNLRTGWASKCRACVRVIDSERNKEHQ